MVQLNHKREDGSYGAITSLSSLGLSSLCCQLHRGMHRMEIPFSKKKVSQTIRKRFPYTVSFNHVPVSLLGGLP